jgi:predicted transcriptional regulator
MRMAKRPALSKAEMEVAHLVWSLQDATVRQVLEALPESRDVDYKTVQTYLRRLEAKGYLASRRDGRTLVYTASVRPRQVIKETVRDFVNRLFGGEPLPLVEHLIREEGLSQDDLGRLRSLLKELESGDDASQ